MRAYTPNSKCAPSRSTIVTGRNPWQLGAAANNKPYFPELYTSVVDTLEEKAGYFVGYTGKGWGPGEISGPRTSLTGKEWNDVLMADEDRITTDVDISDYTGNFNAFLAAKPANAPFFFWFGCREPHRPYEENSYKRFAKELSDLQWHPDFFNRHKKILGDILDYAVEIEYYDQHLGRILARIEDGDTRASNVGNFTGSNVNLGNTLIIATSDNAMPFPRFKGAPYEYAARMPLAIMWKGRIADPGRTFDGMVNFADFAPTFLEVAGVLRVNSGMQAIQGRSLSRVLFPSLARPVSEGGGEDGEATYTLTGRERNAPARYNPCYGYPVRGIIKGRYSYLHNFEPDRWPEGAPDLPGGGFDEISYSPTKHMTTRFKPTSREYTMIYAKRPREELYDIVADPDCTVNLAVSSDFESVAADLKSVLFAALAEQGDPRMFGNGSTFDSFPRQARGGVAGVGIVCDG